MDLQLSGKRALVCAASRGIGFAIADRLAEEGAHVYICSRSTKNLEEAFLKISRNARGKVAMGAYDLTDPKAILELSKDAAKALEGPIDILINNIGGPAPSSAEATDPEQWQNGFEAIFMSAVRLSTTLLNSMKQEKYGRIISITSSSVIEPIEHLAISTAMRSALTAWNKLLASEVAAYGITANTIMPGVIHTDRIENLRRLKAQRDGTTLAQEMEKTIETIPLKRLGKPEEVADFVTFLASPRAAYITGANIAIDGGARKSY